jgi:hypothetical protein
VTFPIVYSRHDPGVLYAGGNHLFRSTDEGQSWTKASPDLSRRDPRTMGASGGPITKDQTGVETYGVIFTFDESPLQKGLLWAGTDDGYVWVSRDAGANWKNVTPKDIGDFTRVSMIEPSHFAACGAYVAGNRYQQDDKRPILYKTTDCGATWTAITTGIAEQEFTRVIREDPERRGCSTPAPSAACGCRSTTAATGSRCSATCRRAGARPRSSRKATSCGHARPLVLADGRRVGAAPAHARRRSPRRTLYRPREALPHQLGGGGFGGARRRAGAVGRRLVY